MTGAGAAGASTVADDRLEAAADRVGAVDAAVFRGSARCAEAAWAPPAGNDSRSRLATGASTVDEALLTNSPISPSLLRMSLLDTPSSLASSCTRALPATSLLLQDRAAFPHDPVLVAERCHRWRFIECPCLLLALRGTVVPGQLGNILDDRCRIDVARDPQGPAERPAPLGECHASGVTVQPCAAAGCAATRIRNREQARNRSSGPIDWLDRCRRHDDAEQLGGRCTLPAADTRADRPIHARTSESVDVVSCCGRPDGHWTAYS
jgi:hypothetical protein